MGPKPLLTRFFIHYSFESSAKYCSHVRKICQKQNQGPDLGIKHTLCNAHTSMIFNEVFRAVHQPAIAHSKHSKIGKKYGHGFCKFARSDTSSQFRCCQCLLLFLLLTSAKYLHTDALVRNSPSSQNPFKGPSDL